MICAKKYETVFKFVKVMPKILVASSFPDTVYNGTNDLLMPFTGLVTWWDIVICCLVGDAEKPCQQQSMLANAAVIAQNGQIICISSLQRDIK